MPRCPNCNYELTFLEKRHKYKCAKCSSLFTEEEIKLKEFNKFNKTERAKGKKQERKKLNKKFRKDNPNYSSIYYQKNKEKSNKVSKKYYGKHREETLKEKAEEYKDKQQSKKEMIERIIIKCMQILPTFVLA